MQPIQSAADLPVGLRDEQDGGHYRLVEGDEGLLFEYVVGAEGPKKYFFPPRQRLFQLHIEGEQFALDAGPPQVPKLALFGIRPCELAAIAVHAPPVVWPVRKRTFREWNQGYFSLR